VGKIASVLGVTAEYLLDRTESVQVADATDEAFYRKYRRMDPTTKDRIRRMVDLWGDDWLFLARRPTQVRELGSRSTGPFPGRAMPISPYLMANSSIAKPGGSMASPSRWSASPSVGLATVTRVSGEQ
jgi:hypothetical protein